MQMIVGTTLVLDTIDGIGLVLLLQQQSQVNTLLLLVFTGTIGNILLMETEVTAILQILGDGITLGRQCLNAELHTLMQQRRTSTQQARHRGILDHKIQFAYKIRLAWMQHIHGIKFMLVLIDKQFNLSIQITFVLQGLLQILTSKLCLKRIVDNRRLAHLSQHTVHPRAVLARHRINTQRQFYSREPARVRFLSHIALQTTRINIVILTIGNHLYFVQQVAVFRNITTHRTATQNECCSQTYGG